MQIDRGNKGFVVFVVVVAIALSKYRGTVGNTRNPDRSRPNQNGQIIFAT